jgi:ABC-type dipeptide/oligopeptide/nickel transport system ATPase component
VSAGESAHVPLLEMRNLSVTYRSAGGEIPAVRNVDFVMEAGQSVGVAGESGCGKSTLASTVLRLQPKSARVEGQVLFEGADVFAMRWGDLRALRWAGASMVFQGALHSLNPVQRIGAQILEPICCTTQRCARCGAGRAPATCWSRWVCRRAAGRLPTSALRWPAPAGHDRDGPGMRTAPDDRRRADNALDVMVQAQVLGVSTALSESWARPADDQPRPVRARHDL